MKKLVLQFSALIGILLVGEITSLAYIGGIAEIAAITGIAYVLFPELAALSYDVFTRPVGAWAKAPILLIVTPLITAIIGLLIEQRLGYCISSLLLSIACALLVIKILNSPIAPAIPAGLLPIVLEEKSWWYPASILFGTSILVLTLIIYKIIFKKLIPEKNSAENIIDDVVEQPPKNYFWLPFFLIFLLADAYLADLTGLRFILFPPLVVIAFEMFAHSDVCPWANKPVILVLACTLTAAIGVFIVVKLGSNPLAVILSIAFAMATIRIFRLHTPPVIAVGLLPFVIINPNYWFPIAVATGTLLLALFFYIFRIITLTEFNSKN